MSEAVENPLFWQFPMQGRSMLPMGDKLREAGFELHYINDEHKMGRPG
jgi:hypothetical protein